MLRSGHEAQIVLEVGAASRDGSISDGTRSPLVGGRFHCPLSLTPARALSGRIMIELVTDDRIVGGLTRIAAEEAKVVYERSCKGEIVFTDAMKVRRVEVSWRLYSVRAVRLQHLTQELLDASVLRTNEGVRHVGHLSGR